MELRNWAGNISFSTDRVHHPETVGQVQEIVRSSRQVRVLGSRHSFNAIADSTGDLICLDRLEPLLEVDAERRQVTIDGGVTYGRLAPRVHEAGFAVVPIPGPSAVATAVSAAGLAAERFAFLGFLPQQAKARRALLDAMGALPLALVIYEAPHRVRASVDDLAAALGGDRTLVVSRELTKAFETIARMPLREAGAWLDADANRLRGEFVLVVDAAAAVAPVEGVALPPEADAWLRALLAELPPARAARAIAAASGWPRDALYARAMALRGDAADDPPT